jgi:hypothetical protein
MNRTMGGHSEVRLAPPAVADNGATITPPKSTIIVVTMVASVPRCQRQPVGPATPRCGRPSCGSCRCHPHTAGFHRVEIRFGATVASLISLNHGDSAGPDVPR